MYIEEETAQKQKSKLQIKLSSILATIDNDSNSKYKSFIKLCEHFIRKFPSETPTPEKLFRGQKLLSVQCVLMQAGQTWYIPNIMSTTSKEIVAIDFALKAKDEIEDSQKNTYKVALIVIDMHIANTGMCNIEEIKKKFCKRLPYSFVGGESEYVFMRTMFEVTTIHEITDESMSYNYEINLKPKYIVPYFDNMTNFRPIGDHLFECS